MTKRNNTFEKIPQDFYPSIDPKIIPPNLIKHIEEKTYAEPCVGSGDLVEQLYGCSVYCDYYSDIRQGILGGGKDALTITEGELANCDLIITNPPFTKDALLPLIDHFTSLKPTWLLLPSNRMHVNYFQEHMSKCSRVISVGRLYWFKSEWVVKEPFDLEELDTKYDKKIEFIDWMKGIKYYTGWYDPLKKVPKDSEYTRGTDDYAWYYWDKNPEVCDTTFETRGK